MAAVATHAEKSASEKSPRARLRSLPVAPLKQNHRIKQVSSPSQTKKLTRSGGATPNSQSPALGKPTRSSASTPNSPLGKPTRSSGSTPNSPLGKPTRSSGSTPNSPLGKPTRSSGSTPNSPLGKPTRSRASTPNSQSPALGKLTRSGGSTSKSRSPALDAFASGLGLDIAEVNSPASFQVFCPPSTRAEDLDIDVSVPGGSKSIEIQEYGSGLFWCLYTPVAAVQHTVSVKVKGRHVPGSPFTADVEFANYTDECSAEGPGLLSGVTGTPCCFTVRRNESAKCERVRVRVFGPSRAEPIELTENPDGSSVDVAYHPTAAGEYTIRVALGEAQVSGSPFHVPVIKALRNDPRKVKVSGPGLNGGKVNELIRIFVTGEPGAGPGPLGVRMVGPSTPEISSDDSSGEGVEVAFRCCDPGEYQLFLTWDNRDLPDSPYAIDVRGKHRKLKPELCTVSGKGINSGTVGEQAKFIVQIPKEAGPGTLEVSATGPQSPEPIDIQNCDEYDGAMQVTYHPTAPGEYTIGVLFGDLHIRGSPFSAHVTGDVVRNAKLVRASGSPLSTGRLRCNQLGTIVVRPGEGAGPGPLRAKLEGPSKAGLQLSGNADGTVRVTFTPKSPGNYSLHLLWGDGESEIRNSPFSIKVVK